MFISVVGIIEEMNFMQIALLLMRNIQLSILKLKKTY